MTVHFDFSRFLLSAVFYQSDPPSLYGGNSPYALEHYAFERNTFVLARM